MPYDIKSHAGPWAEGDRVEDAEFEAHPFKDKFLRLAAAVKVDANAPRVRAVADPAAVADLDAQIAQLQAQRAQLTGEGGGEPHDPANVAVQIDRQNQPAGNEAEATRLAGREVIQPTPGDGVNVGTATPVDPAAESAKKDKK